MTEPTKTIDGLFGAYAADPQVFKRIALRAWPIMRKVRIGFAPEPTTHALLTSSIADAVQRATGATIDRIMIVSTGGSPFDRSDLTDYSTALPFSQSLTYLLTERWRPHFSRLVPSRYGLSSWATFKGVVWNGLLELVGEDIAGKDFNEQMGGTPRSSVSDAYLSLLLSYFTAGILGDEGAVSQLQPLLDIAPTLMPIGETDEPGLWRCAVIGTPLIIKSFE